MARSKNSDAGNAASGSEGTGNGPENDDGGNAGSIGGIAVFNPTEATGSSGAGTPSGDSGGGNSGSAKRGRGRPPGSGSKGKSAQAKNAVTTLNLENILYSAHMMLSKALKVDELELDRDESKLMAEAINAVQMQYDFVVDPKVLAWMGLIGAAGTIYGPRIATYKLRKQIEKEAELKDEKSAGNVTVFPNVGG